MRSSEPSDTASYACRTRVNLRASAHILPNAAQFVEVGGRLVEEDSADTAERDAATSGPQTSHSAPQLPTAAMPQAAGSGGLDLLSMKHIAVAPASEKSSSGQIDADTLATGAAIASSSFFPHPSLPAER